MKAPFVLSLLIIGTFSASVANAADAPPPGTDRPTYQAAPKLSYGLEDVVKLHRAGIGEEVILNFIDSSRSSYSLSSSEILYLKDQGLSDTVINRMLAKSSAPTSDPTHHWSSTARQETAPAAAPAPAAPQVQPAPVYTQPPAVNQAPSTVHVIPYPATRYVYYGSYAPYYYPYASYGLGYYGAPYCGPAWGPSISFGFRFGGHSHFRGRH